MEKSNIGRMAVSQDGFIFEITEVRLEFESIICKGIDIFSGQHRQTTSPKFLNIATERTLKEILVEV